MPIYSGGGGVGGIQVENDPSALKMAQKLADLQDDPTARTNLGVYSTGETDSAISSAISGITFPNTNPVTVLDGTTTSATPSAPSNNLGTIVCLSTSNGITLDGSLSWTAGMRFMVATGNSGTCSIATASNNFINGSNTSHTINQQSNHWVCMCQYDGTNYHWSVG